MKTILFKDATDAELMHYATVMLGLNLGGNPKIKRETIIGRISQAHPDKDAIEDYFTAISGSISVAASECRRLLTDMNGKGGGA